MHTPVLLGEVVENLNLEGKKLFLDCTLGLGGHSFEILEKFPEIQVIGLDQDEKNLDRAKDRLSQFGKRINFVHGNFGELEEIANKLGIKGKVDGILMDIGVASTHFDEAKRGFAFQADGPLDMRMDKNQIKTAREILASYSEQDLFLIFKKYGEEPSSRKIARKICELRKVKKLESTFELKELVGELIPAKFLNQSLKRIFQAIRIEVNGELKVLEKGLKASTEILKKDGRIAVISYHSLEDRIVKNYFREEEKDCTCPKFLPICQCKKIKRLEIITKKAIIPKSDEVDKNPRARSAKLRTAQKLN